MKRSEKELINQHKQHLFLIGKHVKEGKFTLEEIAEQLPCFFQIFDMNFLPLYFNKVAAAHFDKSVAQIRKEGMASFTYYMHPESISRAFPIMNKYIQHNDEDLPWSMLTETRGSETSPYRQGLTLNKIYGNTFISVTMPPQKAQTLEKCIQRYLEDDVFIRKHFEEFTSLTKREKEVLKLIALGKTNKQIADQWFVSKDTIRTHRNSLNKKLGIKCLTNIMQYAQAFKLI